MDNSIATFEDWLKEINRLAKLDGVEQEYTDMTGPECWRSAYDDGVSAQEAWNVEKSYFEL